MEVAIVAIVGMLMITVIAIVAMATSKKAGSINAAMPTSKQLCVLFDDLMDHYVEQMPQLMAKLTKTMEDMDE